jgi:hypothetical protein
MSPVYTRKKLALAQDDARYLARRMGANTWTVSVVMNPDQFENLVQEEAPTDRQIVAGWTPGGEPIPIEANRPIRDNRRTWDVYRRADPPLALGRVQSPSRSQGITEATRVFGWPVLIALAREGSLQEIQQQLDRETKIRQALDQKRARKQARTAKKATEESGQEPDDEEEASRNPCHECDGWGDDQRGGSDYDHDDVEQKRGPCPRCHGSGREPNSARQTRNKL